MSREVEAGRVRGGAQPELYNEILSQKTNEQANRASSAQCLHPNPRSATSVSSVPQASCTPLKTNRIGFILSASQSGCENFISGI